MVHEEDHAHTLIAHELRGGGQRNIGRHLRHAIPHDVLGGQAAAVVAGIGQHQFVLSDGPNGVPFGVQHHDAFEVLVQQQARNVGDRRVG